MSPSGSLRLDRDLNAGIMGATAVNFPLSAIYFVISAKNQARQQNLTVPDVERNLHGRRHEMAI